MKINQGFYDHCVHKTCPRFSILHASNVEKSSTKFITFIKHNVHASNFTHAKPRPTNHSRSLSQRTHNSFPQHYIYQFYWGGNLIHIPTFPKSYMKGNRRTITNRDTSSANKHSRCTEHPYPKLNNITLPYSVFSCCYILVTQMLSTYTITQAIKIFLMRKNHPSPKEKISKRYEVLLR